MSGGSLNGGGYAPGVRPRGDSMAESIPIEAFGAFEFVDRLPRSSLSQQVLDAIGSSSLADRILPSITELLVASAAGEVDVDPREESRVTPQRVGGEIGVTLVVPWPQQGDDGRDRALHDPNGDRVDVVLCLTLERREGMPTEIEGIARKLDARIALADLGDVSRILVAAGHVCPHDGAWLEGGVCPACGHDASQPLADVFPGMKPPSYKVDQLEDASLFPDKRYEARILAPHGAPRLALREIAKTATEEVIHRRWHPTHRARAAYGNRDADGVVVEVYDSLEGLCSETPWLAAFWGDAIESHHTDVPPGEDEQVGSLHLRWIPQRRAQRPAPDSWDQAVAELTPQVREVVDQASQLYASYDRGFMSWEHFEHRLGELQRRTCRIVSRVGRLAKVSPARGELAAAFKGYVEASYRLLLPFAVWNQQDRSTSAEDRSWALDDGFERVEEAEARLLEASSQVPSGTVPRDG